VSLSLNQWTTKNWTVAEAVDGCVRHGVEAIGLWRQDVAAQGLRQTAELVEAAGLRVSSLCRGGFFTAEDPVQWRAAIDDNLRALDETAELGADCLVLVPGGLTSGSTDLLGARARVQDALAVLAPAARERGVRLALEALHPMFCADRSVVSTLAEALQYAQTAEAQLASAAAPSGSTALPSGPAELPAGSTSPPRPTVGVVVDAYHVWWDPAVWSAIAAAGPHIFSFQVCDWVLPLTEDVLLARGMMGDGHIDLRALRSAVDAAGYAGDIGVEIFNQAIWDSDQDHVLETVVKRYLSHVL
jgi:sugar phosphate isomerase/epimerase